MRPASRSIPRDLLDSQKTEADAHRPADLRRRDFLLSLGIGGAGAAALAVGASVGAVESAVPEAPHTSSDARGYQVTEHVRNYYRTTKL